MVRLDEHEWVSGKPIDMSGLSKSACELSKKMFEIQKDINGLRQAIDALWREVVAIEQSIGESL